MKRILALDGGGVRGALSAGFLTVIEQKLRASNPEARLSDHFDMVAGTSTGSIIATAVSLGYKAQEIISLYRDFCPRIFAGARLMQGLKPRFDSERLEKELRVHLGDATLETDRLKTALLVCLKRVDTGSAWFITNNPKAKYWNGNPLTDTFPNKDYKLVDVIRASAAAPFYFDATSIPMAPDRNPGVFLDGGVSPYNCPALAALLVATLEPYGYQWPTGADALKIVSIGTGGVRPRVEPNKYLKKWSGLQALHALPTLIYDSQEQAITLLQALSEPETPWHINRELGDMAGLNLLPEPLLSFQRLDAPLDPDWLEKTCDIRLSKRDANRYQRMDDPRIVDEVYQIGLVVAEKILSEAVAT